MDLTADLQPDEAFGGAHWDAAPADVSIAPHSTPLPRIPRQPPLEPVDDTACTDTACTDTGRTDNGRTDMGDDVTGSPADFVQLSSRTARCADGNGTFAGLFFSDDDVDVARAKAMCGRCALATSCRDGALKRGEAYGVWGGVLLIDGQPARFPIRMGRPSKTPRIEVADEVIVPEHLVA